MIVENNIILHYIEKVYRSNRYLTNYGNNNKD